MYLNLQVLELLNFKAEYTIRHEYYYQIIPRHLRI